MTQVRITNITGETLPVEVYISDVYLNNKYLLGVISSAVPPTITYNSTIPPIFNTAPEIRLTLIDSKNCEISKILDCTFGCAFEVTIELASCTVNMSISV
jgi:hypothetical protein